MREVVETGDLSHVHGCGAGFDSLVQITEEGDSSPNLPRMVA